MYSKTWSLLSLLLLFSNVTVTHSAFNIFVQKFENCDPTVDYINKLYATFRTVDGRQYADGNVTLRVALDNNLKSIMTFELLTGNRFVHILQTEEKHTCAAMHRYVGEFIYDIERVGQVVPGLCPIPPGRYHIHNYLLNFDQITTQNFPFGHLRLKEVLRDKNNRLIACLVAEVEHKK